MAARSHPTPRVALVTGGGRRIGRAIALALADAGYAVAIHARTAGNEADETAAAARQRGQESTVVTGDLAAADTPHGLIAAAERALGPLTLLVNNAALFEDDAVGALDPELWERQFAANLRAPVFLAEAFARRAPEQADASIINIVDQRVFKLTPRQFSYTLTKIALHAATMMLAQALAPRIRVNAVAPGPTLASPRQDEAAFARQAALLPLARGPTPEDVAAAVVYLAAARSVTGVTLAVDGGQHVAWQTPDCFGIDE